jgi:transglutaminase-like putative cysteine protease
MRSQVKLVAFIAVLLFTVSFMSVAINLLGDITDVNLDLEPQGRSKSVQGTESPSKKGQADAMLVESPPQGTIVPLFEVFYPPGTRYLRWRVGETYVNGEWITRDSHEPVPYDGGDITLEVSGASITPKYFGVRPLINLTGYVPATLNMIRLQFDGDLQRYPTLELFHTQDFTIRMYNLTYAHYDFPVRTLLQAETTDIEACLEVPEELESDLMSRASIIVSGFDSPYEQLKAIERYLKDNFEYDKNYTPAPSDVDPIEWFLFTEMRGVCSHFNSAFILLARSIGIPARAVSGYIINPESDYQLIMPYKAHMWVEVPFEGLGWITFDATPEDIQEQQINDPRALTITTITYNDETALKGDVFHVVGAVTTINGTPVDGLTIEVYLNEQKNVTGPICGVGSVYNGTYNVTCQAEPSLAVGDYNLVAHALENELYQESWSDPPITIMTQTNVTFQTDTKAFVGVPVKIQGTVIDSSNGDPVVNATVSLNVNDDTLLLKTNERGEVAISRTFEAEGNETVEIIMDDSRYYIGSNTSFGIAVTVRPLIQEEILKNTTMYPYNLALAAGVLIIVAAVVISRRRPLILSLTSEEITVEEVVDELPSIFDDYKEAIVSIFNHYFRVCSRKYGDIDKSMTPREFQRVMNPRIPPATAPSLEYLVSSFEIADYSTFQPTEEMYRKCRVAYEEIIEVI